MRASLAVAAAAAHRGRSVCAQQSHRCHACAQHSSSCCRTEQLAAQVASAEEGCSQPKADDGSSGTWRGAAAVVAAALRRRTAAAAPALARPAQPPPLRLRPAQQQLAPHRAEPTADTFADCSARAQRVPWPQWAVLSAGRDRRACAGLRSSRVGSVGADGADASTRPASAHGHSVGGCRPPRQLPLPW